MRITKKGEKMIKNIKLFGKLNLLDLVVIGFVILAIGGFTLVKLGKYKTSANAVIKTADVQFDLILKGEKLTSKVSPIKKGDKAFITLRNIPYTDLEIVNVQLMHKKLIIPNPDKNPKALIIDDLTEPFAFDFIVTLKDTAKITKDGPVIGGNKIKMGLPITVEGFNYKFNGTVTDVRIKE